MRTPMPVQDPAVRCHNFDEVALGYTAEDAAKEAVRCLHCKGRPCVSGCPVGVPIPEFIALVKEGKTEEAYGVLASASSLPAVCGRVCPQEKQCEAHCVRGAKGESVAIGRLERFVADSHLAAGCAPPTPPEWNGKKIAVVGSGPAGLSCAGELAKRGFKVTVFEALHLAGGVLAYGIPEFRLPKRIVAQETDRLRALGVGIVTDAVVGNSPTLEELRGQFDAVFLGTGAGLPRFMGIKGENACGVFSANEYLTRVNLMQAWKEGSETPVFRARSAVVVGGGNVAMDAARTARRLGAETTILYRRSWEELPARREEAEHAKEEGVCFRLLATPKEVLTREGRVTGLLCAETELGEADGSGRRLARETDRLFSLSADCVIMALGTSPNPLLKRSAEGLETDGRGNIRTDGEGRTSLKGVYAGGDAVTGSATVILAMGAGKTAACAIARDLSEEKEETHD